MPNARYVLVGTARARVDDVRLVRYGDAQELTAEQVQRLKDVDVEVRKHPSATAKTSTRRTSATTTPDAAAAANTPAPEA